MRWTVDIGTQVPHAALRTYVMGERGAHDGSVADADDIAAMSKMAEAAIVAGALGFTTSRTWAHKSSHAEQIGTLHAAAEEVLGIAGALRRAGRGVVQLISDAYQSPDDELVAAEVTLLRRLALEVGRPMSFTVQQNDETPDRFRHLLASIREWNAAGATARAQVAVRPIGVLLGLSSSVSPLAWCPSYRALHRLPLAERVRGLRSPDLRERILVEHAAATHTDF